MVMMRWTLLILLPWASNAFVVSQTFRRTSMTSFMARVSFENLSSVGYTTKVQKPLGVIFSDNEEPYYGLVVDEVDPNMNGVKAGLKVGDQLLAVNGESVVGEEFEFVMDFLKRLSGTLQLQLYRGTVRTLYTTLDNMNVLEDDDDDDVDVVFDENYESPVRIEVKEEKPLTAGDIFEGLKNIVTKITEKEESYIPGAEEKNENKGLFGGMFSGETIQLEGDDAKGIKGQPRNKN